MTAQLSITKQQAAAELLRRRRARESLVAFAQAVEIPGAPISDDPDEWLFHPIETGVADHHVVLMNAIQACIEKPFGRLMIFMPPGSAKTTYTSIVAPAWAMGKVPGYRVIGLSYSDVPAHRSSRRTRQLVKSPQYRSIWERPVTLMRGSSEVKEWTLTNDSAALWSGLLGSITSARCDLGIIDDPVSGREDADSETMRRKIRQAYEDDFLTRLKPNASIILMMTRWHLDDLAGSILPEDYAGESGDILCRDGQVWTVLNVPAKAERKDDPLGRKLGEYLWPEWFTPKHWAIYEGNARTWNALYQQRPTAGSGGLFEADHEQRYTKTPKGATWIQSTDFAYTKRALDTNPDFTENVVCGITTEDDGKKHLWLEAGYSDQAPLNVTSAKCVAFKKTYDLSDWLIEKPSKAYVAPYIDQEMMDQDLLIPVTWMPGGQDKIAKAASFRALWQAGRVHVKAGPWGNKLVAQLLEFPFGRYDDKVDACGQLGRYIDQLTGGDASTGKKKVKRGPKAFTPAWVEMADREDEEAARRRREYYGDES